MTDKTKPQKLSDLAPKRKAKTPLCGMTLEEALRQVDELDDGDPEMKRIYRELFKENSTN